MDKTAIAIIIAIVLIGGLFFIFQSGFFSKIPSTSVTPTPLPAGVVLFFSPDCPHCKVVEDFITANNIDQKVKYTKLEVPFYTKTSPQLVANGELAIQLAQGCKMDVSGGVGIPFMYDGKNCLLGQDEVINFFKNAAGIQ